MALELSRWRSRPGARPADGEHVALGHRRPIARRERHDRMDRWAHARLAVGAAYEREQFAPPARRPRCRQSCGCVSRRRSPRPRGGWLDARSIVHCPRDCRPRMPGSRRLAPTPNTPPGPVLIRTEVIRSSWTLPSIAAPRIDEPLVATASLVEGRYKVIPGFYLAARGDRIDFSSITRIAATRHLGSVDLAARSRRGMVDDAQHHVEGRVAAESPSRWTCPR